MYNINKREDGRWEVKKQGSKRASKVFDTQSEAINYCQNNEYEYKLTSNDVISKTINSVKKHGLRNTIIIILVIAVLGVGFWFLYDKGYLNFGKPNPNNNNFPNTVEGANFSIHFLELGNEYTGDSTYIKAGDNDILIDAGSRNNSATYIKSYLDQFVTDGKLEYVIATHAHQDHIAGFGAKDIGILYQYEIGTIIDFNFAVKQTQTYKNYLAARDACVKKGTKHYTAGDCWENKNGASRSFDLGEGMSLDIIYNKFYFEQIDDDNEYSVCTMFNSGDKKFLLTGDLELKGESEMAKYYDGSTPEKTLPKVDVFKAGHHGSKTSSNDVLLDKIKPEICTVCCCAGSTEYTEINANLFPTQDFINRIAKHTDSVYVTSRYNEEKDTFESLNGNIVILSNGKELAVNCSNNNTKLKDSEWFNQKIYVKKNKGGYDIVTDSSIDGYFTSKTPGVKEIIRRIWPEL